MDARHIGRTIRQLGLLQIDYVNVLVPAHYQVLFSRLGPYRRSQLDDLVYRRRAFTEHWAHEASILPVERWPLFGHRRATHRVRPYSFETFLEERPDYVAWVLEEVRRRGPLAADEMPEQEGIPRRIVGSWFGSVSRAVLEAHFGRGVLAVARRRSDLGRVYDLTERVIPPEHHGREVGRDEAARAAAVGRPVARHRHRQRPGRLLSDADPGGQARSRRTGGGRRDPPVARRRLAGTGLSPPRARLPARIDASSLLSPFDPVVWHRPRAARCSISITGSRSSSRVPSDGGVVMSCRSCSEIASWPAFDLKVDRAGRRLLVLAAFLEPHARPDPVVTALAAELETWARWLGLDSVVVVENRGDLAKKLADAVRLHTARHDLARADSWE